MNNMRDGFIYIYIYIELGIGRKIRKKLHKEEIN